MKRRNVNLRRVLCAILACALVLLPITPASAATARATTMKLEKTEGTVTLKTQNGTARKISNGMRLYNGNTLKTEKYSYAYVNLDNTKAVKLDQSSSATLRQSGKELELLVKSGKLFFNVSKPLTEKEQMNVRTSTMVTGIRGTCGVVEYVTPNKSKLYLIEGQVTLGSGENATTIQGGQTATVVLQEKQTSGGTEQPGDKPGDTDKPGETDKTGKEMEQKVMVEKMTEESIPPVALQEIVNDPILQEKIEQTTELKLDKIEEALEKFEKEEAERKEQEKAEQEKENENEKEETKEPEKKPEENKEQDSGNTYIPSDSGNSGGSGGAAIIKETTLDGAVTIAMIDEAFKEYQRVHIGANAKMECAASDILNIPGGKMLHIWGNQTIPATINVGDGKTQGLLCIVDSTSPIASLTAGTINVAANSRLEDHGRLACTNLTGGENATLINNQELIISDTLKLSKGTNYQNHGYMSGKDLISEGGAEIINTDRIMLSGDYKINGTNTDTYSDNNNAVLTCSSAGSNVLPDKLLLTATVVSHTTSGDTTKVYATNFNQNAASHLYERSFNGAVTAQFIGKDNKVIVSSDVEVYTNTAGSQPLTLDLQNNQMCLTSGTLTLGTDVAVTGSTTGACIILDNGSLKLDGNSKENIGVIVNTAGGYAIAPSGLNTKGKLIWNDEGRMIMSPKANSVSGIIKGIFKDENDIEHIDSAGYCTFKTDYRPDWNYSSMQIKLEYLPAIFSSTDANVTFDRINKALVNYPVVTVDAPVSMSAEQTVYVPEGKMLKINSTFGVPNKSKIQVSDGATLEVSGTIGGVTNGSTTEYGTIIVGNGGSSAKLKVASTGWVMADLIELKGGIISNNNIIDIGEMTSDGSATINNNALIKLKQAYTSTASGTDSYTGCKDSALISNSESTAMPTGENQSGSELVHATTTTGEEIVVVQYYYSDYMNARVVDYMNKVKRDTNTTTDIKWEFAKDAILPAGNTAAFTGFAADMGTHTLQVKGALTLTNIQKLTGSGKSVIRLSGAGTLTLNGDTTIATDKRYITNTYKESDEHYVISVDADILNLTTARVTWDDINLQMKSDSAGVSDEHIIQGYNSGGTGQGKYVTPSPQITTGAGIAYISGEA